MTEQIPSSDNKKSAKQPLEMPQIEMPQNAAEEYYNNVIRRINYLLDKRVNTENTDFPLENLQGKKEALEKLDKEIEDAEKELERAKKDIEDLATIKKESKEVGLP